MCLFIALASSLSVAASPNKTGMFWGTAYNGPVRDPSYTKGSERGKKKGSWAFKLTWARLGLFGNHLLKTWDPLSSSYS